MRRGGVNGVSTHRTAWSRVAGVKTLPVGTDDEIRRRDRFLQEHRSRQSTRVGIEVRQREPDVRATSVRAEVDKHIRPPRWTGENDRKQKRDAADDALMDHFVNSIFATRRVRGISTEPVCRLPFTSTFVQPGRTVMLKRVPASSTSWSAKPIVLKGFR